MSDATLAAMALRLIAKRGRQVSYVHRVETVAPDLAKPWIPGEPTDSAENVKAAFSNTQLFKIDGTVIQRGDKFCYIAHDALTGAVPSDFDVILDEGTDHWFVQNIVVYKPGDVRIAYEFHLRKP